MSQVIKCHTFDPEHKEYKCTKECGKSISRCAHTCKQVYGHDITCNECGIQVDKEIPGCGHPIKMGCDRERKDCKFP